MKRVYALYRVSTKGQVDKDDIPMQKQACRAFAEQMGWTIIKEFSEKGVSGYKVSANEAVELAKTFSDDTSPAFINGILAEVIIKNNDN